MMMEKKGLTTHVLDTSNGVPAENIKVELYKYEQKIDGPEEKVWLSEAATNADGRVDKKLLEEIEDGEFELLFYVEDYFSSEVEGESTSAFLKKVPIRFSLSSTEKHYHIPLLITPWSYQTYRGS